MLRCAAQATRRATAPRAHTFSTHVPSASKKTCKKYKPPPLHLCDNITTTEGRSWVVLFPQNVAEHPRTRSRNLRWSGNARAAHDVMKNAGAQRSRIEADLIEMLLVLLNTDEFKGPRERLNAMLDALWAAPTGKPKAAFNIFFTACAREAGRVSDNSSVKREVILTTAKSVWQEMLQYVSKPDTRSVALMYRICGDCRDLELAREIRSQTNDPIVQTDLSEDLETELTNASSEDATAAYILCLGKCGRSSEAENLYYSKENSVLRSSDKVLSALFQSFLASTKISKAESLIAMYGSGFLNVQSCNAFVKQCAMLRMHDSALAFVDRMSRSSETGFPLPSARTYNLLLRGLSAGTGIEDRAVAADRALLVVKEMKQQGIEPTTVTYNTLIRSFVFRNQNAKAFALYREMDSPNRITFSHLMQGAANARDAELAQDVLEALIETGERPNYGFCKSYLETVARVEGVRFAFSEAVQLSKQFGDILVFGDVGSQEAVRMALINACGQVGDLPRAFDALRLELGTQGRESGALAPLYVATVLMQVCLHCNAHGQAMEVFNSLKAAGLKPNFEVYESLIYGLSSYVRASRIRAEKEDLAVGTDEVQGLYEKNGHTTDENEWNGEVEPEFTDSGFDADIMNGFVEQESGGGVDLRKPARDELDPKHAIRVAVALLREMHACGAGRSYRQAAYVYNSLIAAAATVGDFELAVQIFNKMSWRNNPGVIYFSRQSGAAKRTGRGVWEARAKEAEVGHEGKEQESLAALAEMGMFESEFEFPAATVGTYNSMIDAARQCGEPWFSFQVFDVMQTDRITEPNAATLSLLADIALSEAGTVAVESQRRLLKELDGVAILSEDVASKRIRLRQKLLALSWS